MACRRRSRRPRPGSRSVLVVRFPSSAVCSEYVLGGTSVERRGRRPVFWWMLDSICRQSQDGVARFIRLSAGSEKSIVWLDLDHQDLASPFNEELAATLDVQRKPHVAV